MRKGQVFLIASLALFSILGIYSFGLLAKDISPDAAPTCYLVFAPLAKLEMDPAKSGRGKLILEEVEATVSGFSLLPAVQGKKVTMERFLTYWKATPSMGVFTSSRSTGLMYYDPTTKQTIELNLALTAPQYDLSKKWLSFDVTCPQETCPSNRLFEQLVLYMQAP